MHLGERAATGASLNGLRAVLCAFSLLWAVLCVAALPAAQPVRRPSTGAEAASAPRAPASPAAAPLEVLWDQDLGEGAGEEGGDCKPPRHRALQVHGSATAVAQAAPVDDDVVPTPRRVASLSRAPPLA